MLVCVIGSEPYARMETGVEVNRSTVQCTHYTFICTLERHVLKRGLQGSEHMQPLLTTLIRQGRKVGAVWPCTIPP